MNMAVIYNSGFGNKSSMIASQVADQISNVTLIDSTKAKMINLAKFDMIGVLSDVRFGQINKNILQFLDDNLIDRKKLFFMYSAVSENHKCTKKIKDIAQRCNSTVVGEYHHNPSSSSVNNAIEFVNEMLTR